MKYERFREVGDVGGELPLEKFDVSVAELLDARLSMLLELSNSRVRGASKVSAITAQHYMLFDNEEDETNIKTLQ